MSAVPSALTVGVDVLKGLLHRFPSSTYCFAYGSAVFAQKNQNIGKMVDLIFVVDNPLKWHTENLRLNPNHYSFLKYFGPKAIVNIQERWACGVYYNTLVSVENQLLKYGVISTQSALDDLSNWTHVYISGRLHKPVRDLSPPSNSKLVKYIQQNRLSALRAVLLQLPRYSTKFELYEAITQLSYIGDSRMAVGENPHKVQNIVAANMLHFDEIYQPLIKELHPMIEGTANDIMVQDMSSETRLKHLMGLPFHLQRCICRKSGRHPALHDVEAVLFEISALPSLGPLVRKSMSDIVRKSSLQQTAQGIFTAGIYKAFKYGLEKVKKKVGGSSEPSPPRVIRPNLTSDEIYKLEMLKEKKRENEISAFKNKIPETRKEKEVKPHEGKTQPQANNEEQSNQSHAPTFSDLQLPFGLKSAVPEASVTQTKGFITFTVKGQEEEEFLNPNSGNKIPPVLIPKSEVAVPLLLPMEEKVKSPETKLPSSSPSSKESLTPPSTNK